MSNAPINGRTDIPVCHFPTGKNACPTPINHSLTGKDAGPTKEHSTHWGVVVFPGSNCDHDALEAIGRHAQQEVRPIWHKALELDGVDAVILPGGFSYGDYLRSGSIARFAPIMDCVTAFARQGGIVIGICNGFQVLTEAGLLPGALMRNKALRFVCDEIYLKVERVDTIFTQKYTLDQVIRIPVAHNEGAFYLPPAELEHLESGRQVVFRYCTAQGEVTPEAN
ncbi:MAG: phosphoribosylformylglycinamidine synthase subunit PurQ, partial [Calditrichota bacterium]